MPLPRITVPNFVAVNDMAVGVENMTLEWPFLLGGVSKN